jgi:hypothetical protein
MAFAALIADQLKCKRLHRGYGSYDDEPSDVDDLVVNAEIGPTLDAAVNGSN